MPTEISTDISAQELAIKDVFNNKYRFEVPDYQRPYAWTSEETADLLNDIKNAADDAETPKDTDPYFLGSVVLTKSRHNPEAKIIDGQQRLATLTILLAVLRDLAQDNQLKHDLDSYIRHPGDRATGAQPAYRFAQRRRDRVFFEEQIQKMGAVPDFIDKPKPRESSRERMFENATLLYTELAKFDARSRERLHLFLLNHCYIVVVSTPTYDSAHKVFSVLNTRGLDLLPVDRLKADIIGPIEGEAQEGFSDLWEDIEEELGRERFQTLFNHIYMINTRERPKTSTGEDYLKGILEDQSRRQFVKNSLPDYRECFDIVTRVSIRDANGDKDACALPANNALTHLRALLRNQDNHWVPVAMEMIRKFRGNIEILNNYLPRVERLAYAMFIMRWSRDPRVTRWGRVLDQLRQDANRELPALDLDTRERNSILEDLNGQIQKNRRQTLLLRLDCISADSGVNYDYPKITVEHVLPQNPARESIWVKEFDDPEEREDWTNRIANLVLLSRSKNSAASNWEFDRKKREYFTKGNVTPFALTTEVLQEHSWTPEVLERRQQDIIGRFKREWSLN